MITMTDRHEIISMYDKTGSIRATARNLGLNRKTITKYVNEYLEAKSSSESDFAQAAACEAAKLQASMQRELENAALV